MDMAGNIIRDFSRSSKSAFKDDFFIVVEPLSFSIFPIVWPEPRVCNRGYQAAIPNNQPGGRVDESIQVQAGHQGHISDYHGKARAIPPLCEIFSSSGVEYGIGVSHTIHFGDFDTVRGHIHSDDLGGRSRKLLAEVPDSTSKIQHTVKITSLKQFEDHRHQDILKAQVFPIG